MPLQQRRKGQTFFGYDPVTGQAIAFSRPESFGQFFKQFDPNAPAPEFDTAQLEQNPDRIFQLSPSPQATAKAAGQAGIGLEDFQKLLSGEAAISPEEKTQIRKDLGIEELEQQVFQRPSRTTEQIYQDAFNTAGLAELKQKIQNLDRTIADIRSKYTEKEGEINENPFLHEASRIGRLGRLKDKQEAEIGNLLLQRNQLADLYNTGIAEVNSLVARTTADFEQDQRINEAKLNYLLKKAEDQAQTLQAQKLSKVYRYIPEFLQARARAQKPEVIGTAETGYFRWNPELQTFEPIIPPQSDLDELLTPSEAVILGVPYGTTKGEAAKKGITPQKPLSPEANKNVANAQSGLDALTLMRDELFDANGKLKRSVLGKSLVGAARNYAAAAREVKDIIVRLRTGAAITENEEKFYQKQLPSILDDEKTVNTKLQRFKNLFDRILANPNASLNQDQLSPLEQLWNQIMSPTSLQGSSRTDRHNNPTAFTTALAKQAGLREGADYIPGDPFPNNPNLRTARLLGDPVALTIKVIDKLGFYTQSGQKRWSHTAIPKSTWDKMSYSQKVAVIDQMYKRENGPQSTLFRTTA